MKTQDGAPGQFPDRFPTTAVRASDQESERAIDALREAAGEGRLTFEELTDPVEAALHATTRSELQGLTADLPEAVLPAPAGAGRELAAPTRQSSVFGDVRRGGGCVRVRAHRLRERLALRLLERG